MRAVKRNIFMLLMMMAFAVFGFGSVSAQAASAEGYFTYTAYGSGVMVTKYTGGEGSMSIPAKLGGKSVLAVGTDIIKNKTAVKSVTLPDTVSVIGESAFANCTELTRISLGTGITSIGNNAFNGCTKLASVGAFPSKLRTIGTNAFYNTNLTTVYIPGNVETVGDAAFSHCVNLRTINIGNGTVNIGANAFSHCTYLSSLSIPNSVRSIGANVVAESVGVIISLHEYSYADKYFANYNRNMIDYYDSEYASSISLNKTSIVLYAGLTDELFVKNAANYDDAIIWKSYDTGIATVDNYGKVTAVGKGTVTIEATATGNEVQAWATVEVKPAPTKVTLVETGKNSSTSSHTLYMGKTMNLSVVYEPTGSAGAPNTTLTSSNPKIATVNASGLVTPVAEGTVNIIVKTYNGKTASYPLTVTRNRKDLESMKTRSLVLATGKTANLGAPAGMTYVSSNPNVAAVANGVVTAKAAGTAVITVYNNDYIAKCTVTVYKPAAKVTIKSAKLKNGKVTLKWKKQSHVSGYQIYYKVGSGKYVRRATKTSPSKVTFTSGKLKKKNKTYYYKVRAYVKVGNTKYYGPFSKVKKFKNK